MKYTNSHLGINFFGIGADVLGRFFVVFGLIGVLNLGLPMTGSAEDRIGGTSACSPIPLEPPTQTRLGSFAVTPFVAAVGSIVTARITAPSDPVYSTGASPLAGGWAEIKLSYPTGEIIDWGPRTVPNHGTAEPGHWVAGPSLPVVAGGPAGTIPGGEFYVRVKIDQTTNGDWARLNYRIKSPTQGWGAGWDNYFAYQERIAVSMDIATLETQTDGSLRVTLALDADGSDRLLLRTTAGTLATPNGTGVVGEVKRQDFRRVTVTIPAGAEAKVFARSPDACNEDAFWLVIGSTGVTDRSAPTVEAAADNSTGGSDTSDDSRRPILPIAVGGAVVAAGLGYALWRWRLRAAGRPSAGTTIQSLVSNRGSMPPNESPAPPPSSPPDQP